MNPAGAPDLLTLRGPLVDGLGEGRKFTAIGWVRQRFRDLLGIDPHPGTVNVRLDDPAQQAALCRLRARPGITIPPEPGFCAATAYRATIEGPSGGPPIPAGIIFPEMARYPPDLLELIAAAPVRATLGLATGDVLTITVELPRA